VKVAVLAAAAAMTGGCAQILGLEETERRDGGGGVCAEDITCSGAADRAVCGRLVDAASRAPFAAAGAMGAACAPGAADGPCAFAVAGLAANDLWAGMGTPVAATVDDCGRFRVEGLTGAALAIIADPIAPADATYRRTASTVLYNMTGSVDGLEVPVVTNERVTAWETPAGVTIAGGFLVKFRLGATPSADFVAKIDTVPVGVPPATPFALYFDGATPYDVVTDMGGALRTTSGPSGTALVVPASTSPFSLGGTKPGKNCTEVGGLQLQTDRLVSVELTNC
jgi:hypothetical protein